MSPPAPSDWIVSLSGSFFRVLSVVAVCLLGSPLDLSHTGFSHSQTSQLHHFLVYSSGTGCLTPSKKPNTPWDKEVIFEVGEDNGWGSTLEGVPGG